MASSTITLWTGPFQIEGLSGKLLLLLLFIKFPVFIAKSVDPDQMPHSAASDQGPHYLPISLKRLLWDARHKWVKYNYKQKCCICSE